jgi:AraC family transcriptional regulator
MADWSRGELSKALQRNAKHEASLSNISDPLLSAEQNVFPAVNVHAVKTPERTTAAAFPRYAAGEVLADSASLRWKGLFVRRYRSPRVAYRFLVPATPEPLVSCSVAGSAEFLERDIGGAWLTRQIGPGHIFVTRSKTPYEVRFSSRPGEELEIIQVHVAVDQFLAALEATHPGRADQVEVLDFFGRDEALAHLCFVCAEMLFTRTPGKSKRVAALTQFFAAYLAEKYTRATADKPLFHGGLPIARLRKVEDYVSEHLVENISVQKLAELVELSPFHFSRVFKESTGMSPLRFVVRERITRGQQLIRETSRSLIEIALEVGYTSPSSFSKVFRRVTGVTPMEFRDSL